jgi:preprotein translocase subunit SecE
MSENKKTEKPGFFARAKDFVVALPTTVKNAFKNMVSELKKVSWPAKKDVFNYSLVVFAFMVVMGIIIGLIDFGSGALIDLIVKL